MYEFFAPGRTEIGGNHTDHQGGCVFGAAVEQGIHAFAMPSGNDVIHIESDGFGTVEMEIGDTEPRAEEAETPAALVRGMMNCFIESGNIFGGFNAKITSDIPAGSGISSSAAFEVLIGRIISGLYFENSVPALNIARFGQIAENDYFGKPCGLMDQLICSVGGLVFADFSDAEMPEYRTVDFDFSKSGYSVALVNCGIGHECFTEEYAQIVKDMGLVAWNMGYTFLSEASEAEFIAQFPILRQRCGEKAVLRALHYYEETRRAQEEAEALESGDFAKFLEIYKESAESSEEKLKNITSEKEPKHLLEKAIYSARDFLGKEGAARVHEGGFGGTAQAIVPEELAADFADYMEKQGFGVMFVL
ncbi:MAG: galactokinase [Oscillospiraceae bacterium]|nr:galactokinase [Oscillospiraceae bacterium]